MRGTGLTMSAAALLLMFVALLLQTALAVEYSSSTSLNTERTTQHAFADRTGDKTVHVVFSNHVVRFDAHLLHTGLIRYEISYR